MDYSVQRSVFHGKIFFQGTLFLALNPWGQDHIIFAIHLWTLYNFHIQKINSEETKESHECKQPFFMPD